MRSKVYLVEVNDSEDIPSINSKIKILLDESKTLDFVSKGDKAAVKLHFGEEGNTGFISPDHVRIICDKLINNGAIPILSDTNTLYKGRRTFSEDHKKLAYEHGFTPEVTGAEVLIPDDTKKGNSFAVEVSGKVIKEAKIAKFYVDADAFIAVNHYKGHILTGFGGALKNIGMGCATREGKLAQHNNMFPVFHGDKCTGCGACEDICPESAIHVKNEKASLDTSKCIGCADCVGACPTMALFVDMEAGAFVQEKMVEYAKAVLMGRKDRSGFINFAIKINKECDCWGEDVPRIAPNVGILASLDPVGLDKACYDLVLEKCGKDVFKEAHPEQDGLVQLKYAEEIGLGCTEYDLIKINTG